MEPCGLQIIFRWLFKLVQISHNPLTYRFSQINVSVKRNELYWKYFILHRYISKEIFGWFQGRYNTLPVHLITMYPTHLWSYSFLLTLVLFLHRVFKHRVVLGQKPSLLYSGRSFHFHSCRFCWTVWNWRLQHSTVITLATEVIIAFCFSPPLSASLSTLAITVGKQFFQQEWVLVLFNENVDLLTKIR